MLNAIVSEFQSNLWLYLSMPITSAVVGYVTNVIALKMMFLPLEPIGKPPFLGWQGVVPSKAAKMATIACDTLVPKLVTEREIFEKLDPERVAQEIEGPMLRLVDHMVEDILSEYQPGIWESLPQTARDMIKRRVSEDAPKLVEEVMTGLTEDIEHMFDLKGMVVSTLSRDKELINRVFLETGRQEFRFVARSGFVFGLLFGICQMLGWLFYKSDWLLPAFGLLVGYATNWIALKLIFEPAQPRKIGPWTIQGLFHKRQQEVSRDYSKLIADEIVTPSNIIEGVLRGPQSDGVYALIARAVKRAIDEQTGLARPFVAWSVGSRRYIEMKEAAAARLVAHLPQTIKHVDAYAKDAMDLANVLSSRLEKLPPDEFEEMLRPAFQEDEWMLIAVGAALGLAVGTGQLLLFKAYAAVGVAPELSSTLASLFGLA